MHIGKKAYWAILGWLAVGSLALAADAPAAAEAKVGQHPEKLEKVIVVKLDYLLSIPADYNKDASKKWPLILFLHGSGERGSDVNLVAKHGPPKLAAAEPTGPLASQFIVVSPQCPEGRWWKPDELLTLIDDVIATHRVDTDRVYCTGLSMGGFGTWELASMYPERFAAVAPLCGGGRTEFARRMKTLPIWIFHGDADTAVPVQRSIEMNAALEKVKGNVKLTVYPGVGHDCWTQTYANPELYTWLLSHKLSDRPAPETREVIHKKRGPTTAAATK